MVTVVMQQVHDIFANVSILQLWDYLIKYTVSDKRNIVRLPNHNGWNTLSRPIKELPYLISSGQFQDDGVTSHAIVVRGMTVNGSNVVCVVIQF